MGYCDYGLWRNKWWLVEMIREIFNCDDLNPPTSKEGVKAMNFVWFILIGIAAGWLAGQIMKGGGFGMLGDLIIGVIGALLGGFLFGLLGITAGGLLGNLITATVGAIALIALLRVIKH
jgi:uncharacterized membrane protein YeaQ/YmgE (transglycosylase-associated protein family)